jgi:hypothetical protein
MENFLTQFKTMPLLGSPPTMNHKRLCRSLGFPTAQTDQRGASKRMIRQLQAYRVSQGQTLLQSLHVHTLR